MTLVTKPFEDIITFTRASGGGRFNSSGVYEWLGNNVPRLDYDPVTLQPRGLLIEEQRTNLLLRSAEFDNAAWSKVGVSVTPNTTISPDGSVNADSVVTTEAYSTSPRTSASAITSAGVTYTYSVWMRAATPQTKVLQITDPSITGYLAQKSVTLTTAWQRFDITFTGQAGALWIRSPAIGEAFEIWGAQLEAGAFPTSYIPTTTAQVTRAADVITLNTGAV